MRALKQLCILQEPILDIDNPPKPEEVIMTLHDGFAKNLRMLVTGCAEPVFGGVSSEESVSFDEMDRYSASRLEQILNFLVESSGKNTPHSSIVSALVAAKILENRREGLCISSSGFQFLLKDSFAQLWILVRSLLWSTHQKDLPEALILLFQLASTRPGCLYGYEGLTDAEVEFLQQLHELGIVIVDQNGFTPTPTGVKLLISGSRVATSATNVAKTSGEIKIFVETNFRVYAYTTSSFQTNLLALFTHLRYRMPSMIVGHLTRDAVRKALMNGITGDQIIGYLNTHAHPRMKRGVIPSNVSDEIRLWEAEQERVKNQPGVLISGFTAGGGWQRVREFAENLGGILWEDAVGGRLVVDEQVYDRVKAYIKKNGIQ